MGTLVALTTKKGFPSLWTDFLCILLCLQDTMEHRQQKTKDFNSSLHNLKANERAKVLNADITKI